MPAKGRDLPALKVRERHRALRGLGKDKRRPDDVPAPVDVAGVLDLGVHHDLLLPAGDRILAELPVLVVRRPDRRLVRRKDDRANGQKRRALLGRRPDDVPVPLRDAVQLLAPQPVERERRRRDVDVGEQVVVVRATRLPELLQEKALVVFHP